MSGTLTVEDVAARLHLTAGTVRRMAVRRDLRASRIGGRWIFREDDLARDLDDLANREPARRRRRRAA